MNPLLINNNTHQQPNNCKKWRWKFTDYEMVEQCVTSSCSQNIVFIVLWIFLSIKKFFFRTFIKYLLWIHQVFKRFNIIKMTFIMFPWSFLLQMPTRLNTFYSYGYFVLSLHYFDFFVNSIYSFLIPSQISLICI